MQGAKGSSVVKFLSNNSIHMLRGIERELGARKLVLSNCCQIFLTCHSSCWRSNSYTLPLAAAKQNFVCNLHLLPSSYSIFLFLQFHQYPGQYIKRVHLCTVSSTFSTQRYCFWECISHAPLYLCKCEAIPFLELNLIAEIRLGALLSCVLRSTAA